MASRDLKDLHYILKDAYTKACEEYKNLYPNDPQPFTCCTHRSNEEQDELFNQPTDGKDNNGNGIIDEKSEKITQAKAGQSPHNYLPSLAFDIAFINVKQKLDWTPSLFKKFAEIIIKIEPKIEWGGGWKFSDVPHYQLLNWQNYKTAK